MAQAIAQDCVVADDYLSYYGKIIGSTIVNVVLVGDEHMGDPMPVFILKTPEGRRIEVGLWSDAEGNGNGHANIIVFPQGWDSDKYPFA